jgi:hypothetical protein
MPRFMVIMKGDDRSEAGQLPTPEQFEAMMRFNEELAKHGVMLAGEGLQPTSKGAKVRVSGRQRTVIDGPFTEAKEIVAGFWLWQCPSLDEAIEWVKRIPFEAFDDGSGRTGEVEIRRVYENEDFGENMTPELRVAEERLREEVGKRRTS